MKIGPNEGEREREFLFLNEKLFFFCVMCATTFLAIMDTSNALAIDEGCAEAASLRMCQGGHSKDEYIWIQDEPFWWNREEKKKL